MTDVANKIPVDLIEAAVLHLDCEEADGPGPPTGWRAVSLLQQRADTVMLSAAIALSVSAESVRRRVGAAILGQLGHSHDNPDGVFREERYGALERLLLNEIETTADADVLEDTCVALGHLRDCRAIPIALKLALHSNAKVRFGVVMALTGYEDEAAIAGLIKLSSDDASDVRDWATFGLGQQIDVDSDQIRAALHARLVDINPDVRNEAIAGLARRKDNAVSSVLARELRVQVATPLFEAARDLADPSLCAALLAAREIGQPWRSHEEKVWLKAMAACGCPLPDS